MSYIIQANNVVVIINYEDNSMVDVFQPHHIEARFDYKNTDVAILFDGASKKSLRLGVVTEQYKPDGDGGFVNFTGKEDFLDYISKVSNFTAQKQVSI